MSRSWVSATLCCLGVGLVAVGCGHDIESPLGELMFEWGKLDHTATGDSTSMGANVQVGYRFLP